MEGARCDGGERGAAKVGRREGEGRERIGEIEAVAKIVEAGIIVAEHVVGVPEGAVAGAMGHEVKEEFDVAAEAGGEQVVGVQLVERGDLVMEDVMEGDDEALFVLVGWLDGARVGDHRGEPFCGDGRTIGKWKCVMGWVLRWSDECERWLNEAEEILQLVSIISVTWWKVNYSQLA